MSDINIAAQISQLRATLEALESIQNNTERADNNPDTVSALVSSEFSSLSDHSPNTQAVVDKLNAPDPQTLEHSGLHSTKSDSNDLPGDAGVGAEQDYMSVRTVPIPQLNRVTWTQFKNSFVEETERYAIDVLIGPARFYWQRRMDEEQRRVEDLVLSLNIFEAGHNVSATDQHLEAQSEMPERIRINCQTLLASLGAITDSSIGTGPIVLLRPYKLLVRHYHGIKRRIDELDVPVLEHLQGDMQQKETLETGQSIQSTTNNAAGEEKTSESNTLNTKHDPPVPPAPLAKDESNELKGLRCLLQFIDTDVMPIWKRYRWGESEKIHFRDLWFLYRPGDLVVSWKDLDGQDSPTSLGAPQNGPATIWRVLSVSKGRPLLGMPHSSVGESSRAKPSAPINKFIVLCHMIAYDGASFGPLDHTFEIASYEGQKDIATLDPCPVRYVTDYKTIEASLIERGRRFAKYTRPAHCLYAGNTFAKHPAGLPCRASSKATPIYGHVIVDFEEAKYENPNWVVKHGMPTASGGSGLELTEDYPRSIWRDKARKLLDRTEPDIIYDDDHVDSADMEDFVASNDFLTAYSNPSGEKVIDHRIFDPIDYALLPDRVVGFDLHRRTFSILAIDCLHSVRVSKEGWTDLKLPRGHKHMIQAQIKTHFMEKQSRQRHALGSMDIDLVHGKGMGLIILLHGAPGVGKTSTAECVADSLHKPLYPITCGDLGVTASEVEKVLNSTFAKAEAWDCVLLLDEADVFLAQRTRTDLKRNAIVSVFLRVLEYYKGILILTTNRVGAFDEAFKSRIHLHLYYPALNRDQTLAIWKMNLDRVISRKQGRVTVDEQDIMRFAATHFDKHKISNTIWNGRQIRNAFQTALAMAEYESLEEAALADDWEESVVLEDVRSHLKVAHFETVADASSQFDMYIEETIGSTDSKRAYMDRDRADHFRLSVPTGNQGFHYGAQWPNVPGGLDPFAQGKTDPSAFSYKNSPSGFYGSQEFAMFHGQQGPGPGPGTNQTWAGLGGAPVQSTRTSNVPDFQ